MPRYYDDDDDYDDLDIGRYDDRRAGPLPQSGLGIASLLLAIGCGVLMFALVAGAAIVTANQRGPVNDNDPALGVLGLGIIGTCGLTLIALVLGIVGCFQPDRSALCGILGSVFNALILFGIGALMCIGILMG
jgi:hypothetical protein